MVISEKSDKVQYHTLFAIRLGNSHCAFMKLVTGTGWMPSDLGGCELKITSARDSGREDPRYFWPRAWT